MTLQAAILFGLKASIVLTVLALGLSAAARELTYLFRHPGKLIRSLTAMDLVMPAFVILLIAVTPLAGPIKIALAALSVSPVPPILPKKALSAGGTEDYIIGLMVAAAIVALVFVPLAVALIGAIFGVQTHISFATVTLIMVMTVLGPLAAGVAVRSFWPTFADRVARPLGVFAMTLLVVCALPIVVMSGAQVFSLIGNGAILVFAAFAVVGLAAGHILGGPDPEDRTVLALSTASRHPGLAIAIAAATFPAQKLVMAAVLLYLVVSAIVSIPYVVWRKRHVAAPGNLHAVAK